MADTLASRASARKGMEVQVLPGVFNALVVEFGRHKRLKISRSQGHGGSTPPVSIK